MQRTQRICGYALEIAYLNLHDMLKIGDEEIERVESFKRLGVWHQNDLKWNKHVSA